MDFVGVEVLDAVVAGVGEGTETTEGDCSGDATEPDGGVGEGLAVAVDLRSRWAVAVRFATGSVASRISNASNDLLFIISLGRR
jgi:hypothetical protein